MINWMVSPVGRIECFIICIVLYVGGLILAWSGYIFSGLFMLPLLIYVIFIVVYDNKKYRERLDSL